MEGGIFALQVFFLKTSAIWPLNTNNKLLLFLYKLYISFVCVLLSVVSLSLLIATLTSNNLKKVSTSVDIVTMTISALYKLTFTKKHMQRFKAMVNFVNTKFKKHVGSPEKDKMYISVEKENARSSIYTCILIGGGVFISIEWLVMPSLQMRMARMEAPAEEPERRFPLACWIPFDVTWSPLYEVVYVLQALSFFLAAHIYLTGDSFFFMMVYQICIQLKILDYMIVHDVESQKVIAYKPETNNPRALEKHGEVKLQIVKIRGNGFLSKNSLHNCQSKLRNCIIFHNDLLSLMVEMEELYRSMILADILHAIISLSFALLEFGTSETLIDLFKLYTFIVVCIVHQYLNSHYGQMLLNAQELVYNSAYNSSWYTTDPASRKYVVLILARSKQFIVLNGGKMYNLCKESFIMFAKSLFSYYMVLRHVLEQI